MSFLQPSYFLHFIVCVLYISFSSASAQREIILKRALLIKSDNPDYSLHRCDYALLVPADRPGKQTILEYKYPSLQPNHVKKTESSEYYLNWKNISFSQLNKNILEVSIRLKLFKYDLNTAKIKPLIDASDLDTLLYLKDEENFRSKAKSIQQVASGLTGNNREDIVRAVFNYVVKSLDYHIFFYQDRGAKQALKDGKGDCTEYSELMITLCRAKKIPARIVMGLIPKINGEIGHHNWVEVFFPQYGWVAFDPTWADHPKATTTFSSMKNTYVQLSNKRYITSILCPCYSKGIPFGIRLRDTCEDLQKNISSKIKEMVSYYNSNNLPKAASLADSLLSYEPDNSTLWSFRGVIYARLENFEKGFECMATSLKNSDSREEKNQSLYAFSNFYALKGEGENAVKYLQDALEFGFANYEHIYADKDFDKIKEYPPFVKLLEELKIKQKNEAAAKQAGKEKEK
ncbi:MAG: hypothetical protein H0W61_07015 [Bacteroidetes bacterium]|nr:hypothetical protein [Bacteroidota bacterium]